jgi:hypothetical protein
MGFVTGANNHVTDDFVLTVINDKQAYDRAIIDGLNAIRILTEFRRTLFKHISDDEICTLNLGFANEYFRDYAKRLSEECRVN